MRPSRYQLSSDRPLSRQLPCRQPPCRQPLASPAPRGPSTAALLIALPLLGLPVLGAGCDNKQTPARERSLPPLATHADQPTLASVLGEKARLTALKQQAGALGTLESDGVGRLSCESLEVKVQVEGRLARTEVTQVFKNHQPRQLEGTYRFMLPAGASIARLAMDVNGAMMEGELVEKEKARNIYESIVRRKKDPALLEWDGGNRFTTRIFPIPARGTKTIVLAYEQLLPQDGAKVRYRYQLPRLVGEKNPERIGKFAFRLDARQAQRVDVTGYDASTEPTGASIAASEFIPNGPVEVNLLAAAGVTSAVVAEQAVGKPGQQQPQHVFGVDWAPKVDAAGREGRDLVIAVDTSASVGDVELDRAVKAAMAIASRHGEGHRVMAVYGDLNVYACDLAPWKAGAQAEVALAKCLNTRMARGASDLRWLIGAAMQAADKLGGADVVLFADGAPSVGELDADLIIAEAASRAKHSGARLNTMAIGNTPDEELLRQLARATGGHSERLLPSVEPEVGVELMRWRLGQALVEDVKVEVIHGEVKDLVPPPPYVARGEPALAMGRLASEGATLRFTGSYAGKQLSHEVQVTKKSAKDAPIVGRFWARAKIGQQMIARAPRDEVVTTSIDWGVMSPHTSFLVLENERMYERNAIDRRKKAERQQQQAKRNKPQAFRKSKERLQDVLAGGPTGGDKDDAKPREQGAPAKDADPARLANAFAGAPGDGAEGAPPPAPPALPASVKGFGEESYRPKMEAAKAAPKSSKKKARARRRPQVKVIAGNTNAAGSGGRGLGGVGQAGRGGAVPIGSSASESAFFGKGMAPPQVDLDISVEDVQGLDTRGVRRAVRRRTAAFEMCARVTSLGAASVVLEVGIDRSGRVSSVSPSSSDATLGACLQRVASRLRYPAPISGFGSFTLRVLAHGGSDLVIDGKVTSIKAAYARRRKLSAAGLDALVRQLLLGGEHKKAEAVFKLLDKKLAKASARERFSTLAAPPLFTRFADAGVRLLVDLVAAGEAGPDDVYRFQNRLDLKRSVKLADAAKAQAPSPLTAKAVLDVLDPAVREERSQELTQAWVAAAGWTPEQELTVVDTTAADPWRHQRAWKLSSQLVAERDPLDEAMLGILLDKARRTQHEKEAGALIAAACRDARLSGERCLKFIDAEGVSDADRALFLLLARRADVENASYIERMADVLDRLGAKLDADRVRSELVEFSPRDVDKRRAYFNGLRARGDNEQACLQAATLVQLKPAERDMFRAMMDLSRNDADARGAIKRCITEGVSMLPVRRDLSLVLTWEDPDADIDVHITEPGGENVNFSHRESKAGGLLYYDVRNGLGPEIYTLGEAPKGELSIGLVYYAGTAKEVPVTLTVMRNAGAPEETREVFELVMRGANPDVLQPVTKLRL